MSCHRIKSAPPPGIDLKIVHLNDIKKIHPRPEYIFTFDSNWSFPSARVAAKLAPDCKSIIFSTVISDEKYQFFMDHLQEFYEMYESLIDEESKKTFYGCWLGDVSGQFNEYFFTNGSHYLTKGFIPESGAIAIDGGVCDGATSVMFTELGWKSYGFELDKANYERTKDLAKEKGFSLENAGLGSYRHVTKYTVTPGGNGGANRVDPDGSETAQIITLDSYVREKNIPRVDFIKLDVEGAELDVLQGARTTIARFKPILAISAYHKWDDFYVLMNCIKSIRDDYEFALRHFATDSEGEPAFFTEEFLNILTSLGLEPDIRNGGECVLFAR